MHGPNFKKVGEHIGQSLPSYDFVSELRYLAAFSNAGRSKSSDVENDANLALFTPHPVKLENVAIANALQLEAARGRAVPLRFNFVVRAKFELA